MPERVGQRLRRLREATTVTAAQRRPWLRGMRWATDGPLSVNGLAKLAHLDPAYVQYLEAGTRHPSRAVVEKLSAALGCSALERAMLLVSAGYWPWPDADDQVTELLIATALAVLDGDYRPLEATVRDACKTGATLEAR